MDRNHVAVHFDTLSALSLSARRAWIEIFPPIGLFHGRGSLSARRAWIEIVYPGTWSGSILGRSPQGERG